MPAQLFLILKSFFYNRKCTNVKGNSFSPQHIAVGSYKVVILHPTFSTSIRLISLELLSISHLCRRYGLIIHTQWHYYSYTQFAISRLIEAWCKNWLIKINKSKSTQATFSLRRDMCSLIKLNNVTIFVFNETKYLGIIFDNRLTWGPQLKNK